MTRRTSGVLTTLAALLFATTLSADNNYVAQEWQKKIEASSAALKAGDHARSLKIANRLLEEMIEMLGPGETETRSFAVVVVHKALASAGLGKYDDARWYWHVAVGLLPALANADLAPFGEAGKFLSGLEVRQSKGEGGCGAIPVTAEVTPPKVLRYHEPEYPRAARIFGAGGVLVVEVVITADGKIIDPAILKALPAPTLSYVALEAVRRWKFAPGKLDGKPVPVYFNLTVNYKL